MELWQPAIVEVESTYLIILSASAYVLLTGFLKLTLADSYGKGKPQSWRFHENG